MPPLPHWWTAIILVFAAYRLTRLFGWDDWPPILKARQWLIGERWIMPTWQHNQIVGVAPGSGDPVDPASNVEAFVEVDPPLPGKQPSSEASGVRPAYDRPTLAHLIHCPFCLGWWVSLSVYLVWLGFPRAMMYAAVPLAVSGAVGVISKNWDA